MNACFSICDTGKQLHFLRAIALLVQTVDTRFVRHSHFLANLLSAAHIITFHRSNFGHLFFLCHKVLIGL